MSVPTTSATEGQSQAVAPAPLAERPGRIKVLWLTNASHALDHVEKHALGLIYPVIMEEMGFGYVQLGVLAAIRNLLESALQGIYGFLTPVVRRTRLLAAGTIVIGLGALLTGLATSWAGLLMARCLAAIGSSGQHPVISSLLSTYFPRNRGTILALNTSVASVGGLLAPALAGLLVVAVGWRPLFVVAAALLVVMGLAYFLVGDQLGKRSRPSVSFKAGLAEGGASYLRVLRNRNMLMIALVMTVGAAGRGAGVNQTYLAPHFVHDLALSLMVAGIALSVLQFGGIVGAVWFGWISDRLSRKGVLQVSLLCSALATLWLAYQDAYLPMLMLNMFVYGAMTYSRNTLTKALIADSLVEEDRDAAFSLYYFLGFISGPFWALLTGLLMEAFSFTFAFSILAVSYLVGMVLMVFVVEPPRPGRVLSR